MMRGDSWQASCLQDGCFMPLLQPSRSSRSRCSPRPHLLLRILVSSSDQAQTGGPATAPRCCPLSVASACLCRRSTWTRRLTSARLCRGRAWPCATTPTSCTWCCPPRRASGDLGLGLGLGLNLLGARCRRRGPTRQPPSPSPFLSLQVDPLVSLMKVEKVPDSTYDMVGGLDQQIKEIKEVGTGAVGGQDRRRQWPGEGA